MSSTFSWIDKLPPTGEVKPTDLFAVEDEKKVYSIQFSDIVLGLENVTFGKTILDHSTDILSLSSDIQSLSAEVDDQLLDIDVLIGSVVQSTTAAYLDLIYPVGSILCTALNITPATYLKTTTWERVANGLFIAGVGSNTDKNGDTVDIAAENNVSNFNLGEYNHALTVAELPAHKHGYIPIQGDDANTHGAYVESAAGNSSPILPIETSVTGSNQKHSNIPPVFGMYIWKRVA